MDFEKKLIEGNFPCQQVGAETKRERGASSALPPLYFLHVWWARRPLTPSRAAVLGSILPADVDPEEFLKELGIRKSQVEINGTWVDIPKSLIDETGHVIWSKELDKILKAENKLREELKTICDKLTDATPELAEDPDIRVLMEMSNAINYSSLSAVKKFNTREVAADPAWFNRVLDITSEYGVRIPNLYGYTRAYSNPPKKNYAGITVLDPTSGGGSIPFEAMRLGCNVIANDLNPVASAIEKATLEYPAKFGEELSDVISEYGERLLNTVNDKMGNYFWEETSSEKVTSYLFCREVTCPNCGERAPLLNSFALQKKSDGWMVIPKVEGPEGHKRVRFIPTRLRNGKGPNGEDPEMGTVNRGTGICIHCGQAIEREEIKRQARGESSYGVWADKLYCVVGVREQPKLDKNGEIATYASGHKKGMVKTEKVTFFREPVQEDFDALERAKKALDENWERWERMDLIPTEKIPTGYNTNQILQFDVNRWSDMFTPRQLLGLLTAMETLHDMIPQITNELGDEKGIAVIHYLQYMIDKCLDYNSRQARWNAKRGTISGTFGRHDFSPKWTFGELVFTGSSSGLAWGCSQVIDAYGGICDLLKNSHAKPAEILNGSAASMNVESNSVDIICVDPPYYNNVQYAELSDYFYVWQKRTFRNIYPDLFGRRLTNKADEAVANPVRAGGAKAANENYERLMGEIFAECYRVMKDNGILTMMFTHKTQEAWETLTKSLIENGWIISASFPVDSEASVSVYQKDKAAAASSIFIACRKRDMSERAPSAWTGFGGTGVAQQLRDAVRASLKDYEKLHLNAVDEMVASYGSALKVLSENWPVMDGDTLVSPIQAMREASAVVAQYQMTKLTNGSLSVDDIEPEAGIALTLFGIYGNGYFPFDDALSLSKSLNIRIENKNAGYRNEARMIGVNDERTGRTRKNHEEEDGYFAPLVKSGSKLRFVLPEERSKKRIDDPLNEWDIMQGVILAYRNGDIPVARAYLHEHADGKKEKVIGVLRVWADGCGSDELSKEAQRILFGLKE